MFHPLLSDKNYSNDNLNYSCLALKPPNNLSYLFSEFNHFSFDVNDTQEM